MNILNRTVQEVFSGKNKKVFIIAEISANHGQSLRKAVQLIYAAKKCGADAVKFQTYTPDTMTINHDSKYFQVRHAKWGGQTLYQLYTNAYTPWGWFRKLKMASDDAGIIFFSTAFDKSSVDLLEETGVPFHKVASFELVDLPLIEYMAKTHKPLMLSTGMATMQEITDGVATAKKSDASGVVLLRCVSDYPARPEDMNIRSIPYLSKKFRVPVGLSDHTLGIATSVAAVSLGAKVIEKHFTLSRKIRTPDTFFSLEPQELKDLVDNVRIAEVSLGCNNPLITAREKRMRIFRRSLFAVKDMKKGDVFTKENVASIRPAYGLAPKYYKSLMGKKAKVGIKYGTPLSWRLINK